MGCLLINMTVVVDFIFYKFTCVHVTFYILHFTCL